MLCNWYSNVFNFDSSLNYCVHSNVYMLYVLNSDRFGQFPSQLPNIAIKV